LNIMTSHITSYWLRQMKPLCHWPRQHMPIFYWPRNHVSLSHWPHHFIYISFHKIKSGSINLLSIKQISLTCFSPPLSNLYHFHHLVHLNNFLVLHSFNCLFLSIGQETMCLFLIGHTTSSTSLFIKSGSINLLSIKQISLTCLSPPLSNLYHFHHLVHLNNS
jgi:hypothetical protein